MKPSNTFFLIKLVGLYWLIVDVGPITWD